MPYETMDYIIRFPVIMPKDESEGVDILDKICTGSDSRVCNIMETLDIDNDDNNFVLSMYHNHELTYEQTYSNIVGYIHNEYFKYLGIPTIECPFCEWYQYKIEDIKLKDGSSTFIVKLQCNDCGLSYSIELNPTGLFYTTIIESKEPVLDEVPF